MDINEIEKQIVAFWKKDKIFEKSLENTKGKKPYIFYDGPPFATGMPHYGHILGSVAKDVFGRFWTMKGRFVRRVWGWDCHGLPIENIAEKGIGINSKDEIEKMGIDKFNQYCRSKVLEYADAWKDVIARIGRWADMENSYKTMDNDYIESVWWAFKQMHEKGYVYKGEKILMYCPRCATPLAKAEIAMDNSYRKVKEDTIVVKFKLKDKEVYALAWTTTPWTLPSNLALAVNPNLIYAYIRDKRDSNVYLLGLDAIGRFYKNQEEYEIIEKVKGSELENLKYEPLFDYFEDKNSFRIILGDFVTSEEGTGIVHTAPAFGEDDYNLGKKYGLPIIQPVDEKGKFTKEVKDFSGEYIHDSNGKIIDFLKSKGKVVLVKKIEHEYPFCYRCETKLMYRAIPAWFVNIQKIKPRLIEFSQKVNWYPEFLKKGRVKYTIETAPDWNISRNRYWATALPVWISEDGEMIIIGSINELKKYAARLPPGEIDLHKDYLDKIILEKDGKKFKRVPEVFDCWFESGSMSFAQFRYPFENKDLFEKSMPAQFVAEYIAQVRTWFYYMMVLSVILFDKIPFENVVATGTILTEKGEKMSKSKQNYTDPMILINKYGADALRMYLMNSSVMNAEDINFSDKGVDEIYKKVILILYNSLRFYNDSKIEEDNKEIKSENLTDKWIISRLNEFGLNVQNYLESYDTVKATNEIKNFVDDLSTWYIRLNRDRFNEGDEDARRTLRCVLGEFSKISAPILPFASEHVFQSIYGNGKSVHLEEYPEFKLKTSDKKIIEEMVMVRDIVSKALKIRDQEKIGIRWPLSKVSIEADSPAKIKKYEAILKQELNVKKADIKKGERLIVLLDTKMTPELEAEGFTRELARKIQAERKNKGLVKSAIIELKIFCDSRLKRMFEDNLSFLKERINAKKIEFTDGALDGNHVDVNIKNSTISFIFS